jgi:hypothetical protein
VLAYAIEVQKGPNGGGNSVGDTPVLKGISGICLPLANVGWNAHGVVGVPTKTLIASA